LCILALVVLSLIVPLDRLLYNVLLPVSNSKFATLWAHAADFLGNGAVLMLLVVFLAPLLYWSQRDSHKCIHYLIRATVALVMTGLSSQVLKFLIGRPRPGTGLDSWHINPFCIENDFHSFPSGHAASAFSVAVILCRYFPCLKYLWLAMAIFISLGRLVGQSHFLTDLAGSVLIAFLITDAVLNIKWRHGSFLFVRDHAIKDKAECA